MLCKFRHDILKYMTKKSKELEQITNFFYEVGQLAKVPRSWTPYLGTGQQSVAEHLNRVCYIVYALCYLEKIEPGKVVMMALFHDISETRISDLNHLHQKYTTRLEEKAHTDIANSVPFGKEFKKLIDEYEDRKSLESMIVKDADTLEFIISLKEQIDIGNSRAKKWLPSAIDRLKTSAAKELVKEILKTESDTWWFAN